MPQLDFFTLLFQFKSFTLFFFSIYFLFVFIFVPKLHLVISVRRSYVLHLLAFRFYLNLVLFCSHSTQSFLIRHNIFFFNDLSELFFPINMGSKLSIELFLSGHQDF
jgi:hypothetical protein